ncbi:TMV resistance protein N-like [Punica granatum]|uniref:TMV resistance protein N-like n=1 Tax=Punica granatum TaxID=22663 RepID=A0A6P8BPH5_PUNGR|nr:TMV resistance protein N-like [Punica granatum]
MAPNRNNNTSSPPPSYQVFLSFRGPDTRQGFTDVLYHTLVDAGIRVFRDNEEIRKGEYIGEEILRAIEDSRIFVPIFSRTYASSKWCLIELAKMVESKEYSHNKKILPIFYDVGVNDVKLKTELYTGALLIHKEKFSTDIVHQWEEALRDAGKIKGWALKDKGFAEFAKEFVREVSAELKVKQKYVTGSLVERIDLQDALTMLLDVDSSLDVRLVWIHGMGGIGKTTLAKDVFNRLCNHFKHCSFLLDVQETTKRKGIEHLQRQLLQDLGVKAADITDENDGIQIISEKLQNRKVLVVLDDVHDHQEHIGKLAREASWFGVGSRIIITSRSRRVPAFEGGTVKIFEAKPMEFEESLLLFSRHAFGKESPPHDSLDLSKEAVRITGGLPLALEVIGSKLRTSDRGHWNHMIGTLQKIPARKVQDRLKICYDALDWEVKEIFLDIACFFINEEKTKAIYMWQACDFEPELAVQELVDASLVKLTDENKFRMHDQLRDLGRKLVRDERLKHHGKPCSRIWMHEDALKVLHDEEMCKELKVLDLKRCDLLIKTPNLSMCTKLERLILKGCINLVEIDHSVGKLKCLKYLNASGCSNLREIPREVCCLDGLVDIVMTMEGSFKDSNKLPDSIGRLSRLQRLRVSLGRSRPPSSLGDLKSLTMLVLSWSRMTGLPESIGGLVKLEFLSLFFCGGVKELPASIRNLKSLAELNISKSGITQLPDAVGNLQKLKVIDMRGCVIRRLPDFLGNLEKLERLDIFGCNYLQDIPSAIKGITSLLEVSPSAWDKSCERYWKLRVQLRKWGVSPFSGFPF